MKTPITVRFSDIDMAGHVHNSNYLSYFEQARIDFLTAITGPNWNWKKKGLLIGRIEVDYILPLYLRDKVFIKTCCDHVGNKSFTLSYELFKNDAVIYEGLKSQEVTLKSDKHNHGLTFKYPEWRYLAFWTKGKDVPFVCLEPWRGITDADDSNGDYVNKVGVEKLAASKHFDIKHSVEIF